MQRQYGESTAATLRASEPDLLSMSYAVTTEFHAMAVVSGNKFAIGSGATKEHAEQEALHQLVAFNKLDGLELIRVMYAIE
jgi:hypothetical protein